MRRSLVHWARIVALVTLLGGTLAVSSVPASAVHGSWSDGANLLPQSATVTNGGPITGKVAETCDPNDASKCGRGMFGGTNRLGTVLLNSNDAPSDTPFGCPSSATSNTADASTVTSQTDANKPRALVFLPGVYVGGKNASGNTSGETECYNPYPTTGNSGGKAWSAARTESCAPDSSCVARDYGVAVYIPITGSGTACAGKVLYAGGETDKATGGQAFASSQYYDPHPTRAGVANANFNKWTAGPPAKHAFNTATWVKLNDGRILIAGGKGGQGDTGAELSTYELFRPSDCTFQDTAPSTVKMTQARSYFGMGVIPSGASSLPNWVVACGGWSNFNSGTALKSCEVFNPGTTSSVGTWKSVTGTLSVERGSAGFSVLPNNKVLFAAGAQSGFTANLTSEECAIGGTTLAPTVTCGTSKTMNGSTSHLYPSVARLGDIAGGVTASGIKNTVLLCGGFQGNKVCDYYVPSGTVPSGLTCVGGATSGPAWCKGTGTDMQRERADFLLQELPAVTGTGTAVAPARVAAMGGTYGQDATGNYLTRKTVEYLDLTT